jgi:hypothetical protein
MDARLGLFFRRAQIPREVLGESLDGRFGRVVSGVAGRVGDALLGARDDDCGGRGGGGGGLHGGEEGAQAVDDAEEVGVYYLVEVGGVGPGAAEADASVEGEEVDFPFVGVRLCCM